jgi:hypothetical protein
MFLTAVVRTITTNAKDNVDSQDPARLESEK